MSAPKLDYYFFPSCPFCQRVLVVIQEHQVKVEYKDIMQDRAALDKLVSDTGRRTVPCLYIDGNPMHESADIIDWLNANLDNLEKVS
ncbi:MAG: glutaredoxin family protein [Bacteriovoracaceae bacterium]